MATSLSFRGCTIHLRTRITDHEEDGNVSFVGAGPLGEGTIRFYRTMDALDREPSIVWEGGVFFPTEKKNIENSGNHFVAILHTFLPVVKLVNLSRVVHTVLPDVCPNPSGN